MEEAGTISHSTDNRIPLIAVIATTVLGLAVCITALMSGVTIIFQNLLYLPIILSCFYFTRRGFVFSIVLAVTYFLLFLPFTTNPTILFEAFVRVVIFIGVAGVVTILALYRDQALKALEDKKDELRSSHQMLQTVLDTIPIGVFWKDRNLRYLGSNRIAAMDAGLSDPAEMIGKCDPDLSWNALAEAYRADDIAVMENKKPKIGYEEKVIQPDGKVRWVSTSKIPLCDQKGEVFGVMGTYEDITDRKRAEEALRESEEQNRRIIETATEGIWVLDTHFNTTFVNRQMAGMLGYSFEEMAGKPMSAFMDVSQLTDHEQHMINRRAGISERYERIFRHKDGSPRWMMVAATPLHDQDNIFTGSFAMVTDITERKQAELSLFASKQLVESIIDSIPVRVFWKDKNLVYLGCNTQFAQDAGFSRPDEIIGKDDFQMGWRDQAKRYRDDDYAVIESGKPKLFIEEPQTTPQGTTMYLLTSKTPLRNSEGEIIGVLGAYLDITDRKRAEEILKDSEEQFRVIFHNQQTGLLMIDPVTHRITDANETALSMIGASRGEVVGEVCHTFICPSQKGKCPVTDLGLRVDKSERVLLTKSGYRIPVLKSVNTITIRGKQFLIESFIDITDRKRAEETRSRLAAIVDSSMDAIFSVSLDGSVASWNGAAEEMFKYSADEMIGRHYHDLLPVEKRAEWEAAFRQILKAGFIRNVETKLLAKGGMLIETSVSLSPVLDDTGTVTGIAAIVRDLSDQRKAERDMVAYITEAALRLQKPVGLIRENLVDLSSMVEKNMLSEEEISMFLLVQARNAEQILENVQLLNNAILEGHEEIPKRYREFLSG